MTAKSCVSCGGELKFNRSTGLFECTFCGKIHTMRGKDVPLSLARVDRDMYAHRFDKAEESLSQLITLEPDNPLFVLRDILCDFHMTSATTLLSCAKTNPNLMSDIRNCEKWNDLKNCLPGEQQEMVDKIKEYCDISLALYDTNVRIEKNEAYLDVPPAVSQGYAVGTGTIHKPKVSKRSEEKEAEQEPDTFGRKIFSKLKNTIESSQYVGTRVREDTAIKELAADRKKKVVLEKHQQDLFKEIKEMEDLL